MTQVDVSFILQLYGANLDAFWPQGKQSDEKGLVSMRCRQMSL